MQIDSRPNETDMHMQSVLCMYSVIGIVVLDRAGGKEGVRNEERTSVESGRTTK